MSNIDSLREQAAWYRRIMRDIDDPKAKAASASLAEECEAKLAEAEKAAAGQSAQDLSGKPTDQP